MTAALVPLPPETIEQRIARLEREIVACGRNHALLRKGAPRVISNNETLRTGIRSLIDGLPDDPDLGAVAEKLGEALAIPVLYPHDLLADIAPPDDSGPVDPSARTVFLEERLREANRANYLVQIAGAPIVRNSDAMRSVMTELRDELDPKNDDEAQNPLTLEQAMIMAIVDEIDAVLKAAADRPDK